MEGETVPSGGRTSFAAEDMYTLGG